MSYVITVIPLASQDFNDSALWYEEQQDGLGDQFIDEVKASYMRIINDPKVFPKRVGIKQECVLKKFPFVILFQVDEERRSIFVLAIYHTSRNPKQKLRRKF